MDGSALIRTFLIFFAGGLLLTAAAISVFLIGNMVWLYCLDGNPNQACGDALFYGAATPIYGRCGRRSMRGRWVFRSWLPRVR